MASRNRSSSHGSRNERRSIARTCDKSSREIIRKSQSGGEPFMILSYRWEGGAATGGIRGGVRKPLENDGFVESDLEGPVHCAKEVLMTSPMAWWNGL